MISKYAHSSERLNLIKMYIIYKVTANTRENNVMTKVEYACDSTCSNREIILSFTFPGQDFKNRLCDGS